MVNFLGETTGKVQPCLLPEPDIDQDNLFFSGFLHVLSAVWKVA
jgi:hypothetical protein